MKEFLLNIIVGIFGFLGMFLALSGVVHIIEFIITNDLAFIVVFSLIFISLIHYFGKVLREKD